MNSVIKGIILGAAQGISEFLPVSSSGHLVLLGRLGIGDGNIATDLILHLATLIAVIAVYYKQIWEVIRHPLGETGRFVIIASLPTAVCAAVIRYFFYEKSLIFLPTCFLLTSVLLISTKIFAPKEELSLDDNHPVITAFTVGIMQGVACLTGVSRSGATTAALLLRKAPKDRVSEYTFLLSIPIILGSALVELIVGESAGVMDVKLTVAGALTALICGLLSIKIFSKIVKANKFWIFSIYTFLIAIASFFIAV